jgi:hypothetical protein
MWFVLTDAISKVPFVPFVSHSYPCLSLEHTLEVPKVNGQGVEIRSIWLKVARFGRHNPHFGPSAAPESAPNAGI